MTTFDTKNPSFTRLSRRGQVLLAAWAVLAVSSEDGEALTPEPGERLPTGYTQAIAELMKPSRPHYRSRQLAPSNRKRNPRTEWRVTT